MVIILSGWLTTARGVLENEEDKIYETLGIEGELSQFSERECPFPSEMEQPVTVLRRIAITRTGTRPTAKTLLFSLFGLFENGKGFGTESLLGMEHSTKRVMELLADPHRTDSYQSKALLSAMSKVEKRQTSSEFVPKACRCEI